MKKRIKNKTDKLRFQGYRHGFNNKSLDSRHSIYQQGWHKGWLDLLSDVSEAIHEHVANKT